MRKCAKYLLLLNPKPTHPSFLRGVLICNNKLDFADNISTLTTSVMLNSANRQCWRKQQEERKNKGLFFFQFSLLSRVNGDQRILATIIPAATCSHGSGKQLGAYFCFTLFSTMFLQQPASLQILEFPSCRGKTPPLSFQGNLALLSLFKELQFFT